MLFVIIIIVLIVGGIFIWSLKKRKKESWELDFNQLQNLYPDEEGSEEVGVYKRKENGYTHSTGYLRTHIRSNSSMPTAIRNS